LTGVCAASPGLLAGGKARNIE